MVPSPFLPGVLDATQVFSGQFESVGLIVTQWDAATQSWLTATYTPGSGWSGDNITLAPALPFGLSLPSGHPNQRLSFGGLLPDAAFTRNLVPGLNHVGSPRLSSEPLTVWNWHLHGVAGSTLSASDVLHDPANQPQAWLRDDQGVVGWAGVADPAQPGELVADAAYFYEHKGTQPVQVEGSVATGFDSQLLPGISGVVYNAAQDRVEVTVATAPGSTHTLDLFYQDLAFPGGYDPAAPWEVWSLAVTTGAGQSFTFFDDGDGNRPHPQTPAARLYQVGDALLDTDGDGVPDMRETLVHQTDAQDPETDGDGVPDGVELQNGLDPLVADAGVSAQNLIADVPLDTHASDTTGRLASALLGGAVLDATSGRIGGALVLQGSGQKLEFEDHPDFNTAGPYSARTFSLWFAVDSLANGKQVLFESGGTTRGFNAYVEDDTLYVGAWDSVKDAAAGDQDSWSGGWLSTSDIRENTWHHVVLVLDATSAPTLRHAGALRAYLDGVEIGPALDGMQVHTHGDEAALGGVHAYTLFHDGETSGAYDLIGAVDDFKVWNRALTTGEVALLYYPPLQNGQDPLWNPEPIAMLPLDQDFTDLQVNLSVNGVNAPTFMAGDGVAGGAVRFQQGQAAEIQSDELYNIGGPYTGRTISFWFSTDHFDFGRQVIYDQGGSSRGLNIYLDGGVLYAGGWDTVQDVGDLGIWPGGWQWTDRVQPNTWHHVVLVLDASGGSKQVAPGVLRAYLDGVPFENGSTDGMRIASHNDPSGFGKVLGTTILHDGEAVGELPFFGGLDEAAIWNRPLDAGEVSQLYSQHASSAGPTGWDVDSFYTTNGGLDADPDGDGLTNAAEVALGLDQNVFDRTLENADALFEHLWFGLPTGTPDTVTSWPQYPYNPDQEILHGGIGSRFMTEKNVGEHFGRRMFGRFVAPLSGDYVFYIRSDDGGELWLTLNGVRTKILTSSYAQTNQSAPITLQAGESYPLEAIMIENTGGDHLMIGIKLPDNRYEIPMRVTRFIPAAPGTDFALDTDGDGLSDYEESVYGTNPGLVDTSGDGLSDFASVVHNRDPLVAQTLMPLLPHTWVLQHDIYTVDPYTYADPDGDLLVNIDEYLYGTDPNNPDTSGDGVTDFEAVHIFRVDPLLGLFTGNQTEVSAVAGNLGAAVLGVWEATPEGTLRAGSRSGTVSYEISVPTAATYAIVFDVEQANPNAPSSHFVLHLDVDGLSVGRYPVQAPFGAETEVMFISPVLEAGEHTLRLRVENVHANSFIEIHRIRLLEIEGTDTDNSGIPDWVEYRSENAIQSQPPLTSAVSPVCVEGTSLFGTGVILTSSADDPEIEIQATPGPNNQWFADMNLDGENATELVIRDRTSGASETHVVTWIQTDLLPQPAEPIVIRVGDTLLLNAVPDGYSTGDVILEIGSVTYQSTVDAPVAHTFETEGEHLVVASWSDGVETQQSQTMVRVVSSSFATPPVLLLGQMFRWDNPDLGNDMVLEFDPALNISQFSLEPEGRTLRVRVEDTRVRHIWARLGENGPVIDHATAQGIKTELTTRYEVVDTYSDGTRLVEMSLAFSDVPENLRITLISKSGGILFQNGSLTQTLTADDVGEDGVLRYYIYQSPLNNDRICHDIEVTYE